MLARMAAPVRVVFAGGGRGAWRVERVAPVIGESLPTVARLAVDEDPAGAAFVLRGVTSHHRYVERREKEALAAIQPPLGRPDATCAALIPIKKTDAWWDLPQDERRAIFEDRSRHIAASMKYMPAVARRLYHSRELGEPFDFLTWFEYAPRDAGAFEELVVMLRATEEWRWVEREVDIRLAR
jgi:chlorite dismutase